MKKIIVSGLFCAAAFLWTEASEIHFSASGAPPDIIWSILFLTGAEDAESVPESEFERFREMAGHPLRINYASRGRLLSSGLMSAYQAASLLDYRARSGDILSISELASVDGFGRETAEALRPFISLESGTLPGQVAYSGPAVSGAVELAQSTDGKYYHDGGYDLPWSYSSRLRIGSGSGWDAGVSMKRYGSDRKPYPSSYTFSATCYGRRHLESVTAGDMSLRFGQGLALWTGFSIGGFSGERSFWRRPAGISPSYSFSGSSSVRGVAAALSSGKVRVSLFSALPALRKWCENGSEMIWTVMSGGNVTWYPRHGQAGVTALFNTDGSAAKVSSDMRFCLKGVELYGEVAYDIANGKAALTAGFMSPLASKVKTALTCRYIPDGYDVGNAAPLRMWSGNGGETGVAVGLFVGRLALSADMAYRNLWSRRQIKVNAVFPWDISPDFQLSVKIQERLRSYDVRGRTEMKTDLKWMPGSWRFSLRADAVVSRSFSWLAYLEEGYEGRLGAVFLRGTLFMADSWDDRIYSYERDAPGSFNVPAYYGRGWAVSSVGRLKLRFGTASGKHVQGLKMYVRVGFTDCPWSGPGQKKPRPARSELKFMLIYDF